MYEKNETHKFFSLQTFPTFHHPRRMHSLPILLKKHDSVCFKGAIHPAYRRLAFALFSSRILTDDSQSECTVQSIIAVESIERTFCIC